MLLQANDYRWLHEHHGCELQIGGSDQWGNILAGVDLIRRRHGAAVHAPLLAADHRGRRHQVRQDHRCPGLARPRAHVAVRVLPALDQHRRRRAAAVAGAVHPPARGRRWTACWRSTPPSRGAGGPSGCWRARSPRSCTGRRRPTAAEQASDVLFGGDPRHASPDALAAVAAEVPSTTLDPGEALDDGVDLVGLLLRTRLAASQADARRQLEQRGVARERGEGGARPPRRDGRPPRRTLGAPAEGQEGVGGPGCPPPELTLSGMRR